MLLINSIMKNYYKLDNQQETFSLYDEGSSETIRRTTFNLDMLYWFVGFLEGDGSFIFSNKRYYFIITQNELVVLYKIKNFLKLGRVQKHGIYFRFIITIQKDFIFLIKLIYRYIFLNKTYLKINKCLNKDLNKNIDYNKFDFYSNAWLSGFIDAEGCFYVKLIKRKEIKIGYQIRILFILDQKFLGDDLDFFKILKDKIGGYFYNRKNNNYRFILEDNNLILHLINYLKRYPLVTHKKSIQYKHWLTCWRIKNKKDITFKDLKKIQKIKSWRYSPPKYESI